MNAAETLTPRYLADPFGEVLLGRRILLRAAEDRLRLDRLSDNAVGSTFFPWAHHPAGQAPRGPRFAHSSRGKKATSASGGLTAAVLRAAPALGVRRRSSPASGSHRGRGGRGLEDSKERRHG